MMVEKRILVVEDSPVVLKVLNHLLSQNSIFTPVLCASYEEAQDKLKASEGGFFAAIVDLNLPDAENGEIVDLVLSRKIPCVVLTANFDDKLRLSLLNKGVLDYITKDSRYSFNHVIKVIERLHKNQGIKVLVAEDSATSRLFTRILLEQYCFNVIDAVNGQEALAKLEADSEIRMLITDHNMPLVSGYDLVRMLRFNSRFQDLVIIGLSAEGDNALSAKFIKAGANDFLKKPFYHEEFHCRVVHSLEAQEMLETIRDLASVDPLTKLKNRRYLFDQGERLFRDGSEGIALAILGLDNFKGINETYGHLIGDTLLEVLGREIQSVFSDMLVCRLGGDEFCVVSKVRGECLIDRLSAFLIRLRKKEFTEAKISLTCSVGVGIQSISSFEGLVREADLNLQEAKRLGRDRIVGQ
ncbi:response regulator [Marinomonas rhizomae]|uniref:Response regulator receiver modulated diguanylate cyclase n=1 Tax=Marinomonas rhizomae TaxID=491948 RepID=A0A366J0J8_9GAMM|nr:response regulator [Marinomonas rhizomae]RBP80551.1 response regulator receiver modulated diguanylate cyclase [Marinomonas rhizomae]